MIATANGFDALHAAFDGLTNKQTLPLAQRFLIARLPVLSCVRFLVSTISVRLGSGQLCVVGCPVICPGPSIGHRSERRRLTDSSADQRTCSHVTDGACNDGAGACAHGNAKKPTLLAFAERFRATHA